MKTKEKRKTKNSQIMEIIDLIPSFCDKCGAFYNKDKAEIIDQENDNVIVTYIMCDNCMSKNIMYVVKPLNIINKSRLNIDLRREEITFFAGKPAISTNEVIEVFESLKKYQRNGKILIDEITNAKKNLYK